MFTAFLFLSFAFNAKAQSYVYRPFPVTDFTWKGFTSFGAQSQSWISYWTYYNQGDTILGNFTYHKIASNTYTREDSIKRVYFTSAAFALDEKLLYDFSLVAGDTMLSGQTRFQIDSVDTLDYYGVSRRTLYSHWHVGALSGTDIWMEGIGSYQGPLGVWHMFSGPGHSSVLCKASESSIVKFERNDMEATICSNFDSLDETSPLVIHLSPNPANQTITLIAEESASSDPFNVLVYDITGACVRNIQPNSIRSLTIPVNDLSPGYYVVKVSNGNHHLAAKGFIIAR